MKGKFTVSLGFSEYDEEVMKSYYKRVVDCMAQYEPETNDYKDNEVDHDFEEMGNIMAELVNDYDNGMEDDWF